MKCSSLIGRGMLLALVTFAGCASRDADFRQRPLYTWSEEEFGAYLPEARSHAPDAAERVVHLARRAIGQPYEIYLLGEFPFEGHDPDPLYCLSKSDCVTFCEHMYAAALADDWWSFLHNLQRIRYAGGRIGMLTRNHFTIADWNRANAFLFDDLTARLGDGRAAVPLQQTVRRARFFAKFGIGQDVPDEPLTDVYIPASAVAEIEQELRPGDFVNIIRGNPREQYCGHTGMIAFGPRGEVNLLHSVRPNVREERLVDYLERDKSLGIRILRLRPDAERRMTSAARESGATPIDESALNAAAAAWPLYRGNPAPSYARDWKAAMALQAYRLTHDTPVDSALQKALADADARVRAELHIPEDKRAIGVLDLSDLRLAMLAPDRIFYGASVPKIVIAAAYLDKHPEQVADLDPAVRRELELVIKRSDNELAAKYSRIVGLDYLQEWVQSRPYQFYDAERGGGLWCGKHYGIAEPRIGDPVGDHSHAATVRQCLRFYLMMEQGRLVNARAAALLKEIFAAPSLDYHAESFVGGLRGRNVTLIRKSGWWENWNLDTARVQHDRRVYLLAGATEHPDGRTYLARMAAAIDDLLGEGETKAPPYAHHLVRITPPMTVASVFESPVLTSPVHFNEALASWNVALSPGAGASLELRVRTSWDGDWSPWMLLTDWGAAEALRDAETAFEGGRIEVDYFVSPRRFDQAQLRIRTTGGAARVTRLTICLSDTTGLPVARRDSAAHADAGSPAVRLTHTLEVPFRSQKSERPEIAGRVCSPTSLAMVMQYRGVNLPTQQVADAAFNAPHEIYGDWPRNVQAAYALGVPGYLTRISDWETAERYVADGQPLIISVRAREGELRNAPYRRTNGHLLVLTGFDANGNVTVNDPAASDPASGRLTYYREDLERCWMRGSGGVAYVLLPVE